MATKNIATGTVHSIPTDVRKVLIANGKLHEIWNDITPLARNEWLCWITSAKQLETRERRIRIMGDKLAKRISRPCCWAGCIHR